MSTHLPMFPQFECAVDEFLKVAGAGAEAKEIRAPKSIYDQFRREFPDKGPPKFGAIPVVMADQQLVSVRGISGTRHAFEWPESTE